MAALPSKLAHIFHAGLLASYGAAVSLCAAAARSKWRSIAACSRGNLWRDIERLLGVPLAERKAEEVLRERCSVRREGPSGTVNSGAQAARAGDAGTERDERRERSQGCVVSSPQSEPASDMQTLRQGVLETLKLNSLGTVREVERRAPDGVG